MHIGLRRIFFIGPILVCISAFLGCGHSRTVAALVEADSLMWTRPDSSLALVRSVSPDTLDDENRAYHALLLTQAQFRNGDTSICHPTIDIALNYYSKKKDKYKTLYPRAVIYKGAVYKREHKYIDAIKCEFNALERIDSSDYTNLGQAYLRLAVNYTNCFMDFDDLIDKYETALHYLQLCGNHKNALFCKANLGSLYSSSNLDKAERYLYDVIAEYDSIKDIEQRDKAVEYLSRIYNDRGMFQKGKNIIINNIDLSRTDVTDYVYYDLAWAYANLGHPDSAKFYFAKTNVDTTDSHLIMLRELVASELFRVKGLYKRSLEHRHSYAYIADSLIRNETKREIKKLESDFENITKRKLEARTNNLKSYVLISVVVVIITIILLLSYFYISHKILLRLNNLIRTTRNGQEKQLLTLQERISKTRELANEEYYPTITSKKEEQLRPKLRDSFYINQAFWADIDYYLNLKYDNIADYIDNQYNNLAESEIRLMKLMLCDFNYIEISVCLGISPNYVRVKRNRIEKKLKLCHNLFDELLRLCAHLKALNS